MTWKLVPATDTISGSDPQSAAGVPAGTGVKSAISQRIKMTSGTTRDTREQHHNSTHTRKFWHVTRHTVSLHFWAVVRVSHTRWQVRLQRARWSRRVA
eukprot:5817521-Prymnesium_polylepis.1